jgi:hypothetical protein
MLRWVSLFSVVVLLSACSGGSSVKGENSNAFVIPSWVSQTPKNSDSYDVVVSLAKPKKSKEALRVAFLQLDAQLQKDLKKIYVQHLAKNPKQYFGLEKKIRAKVEQKLPTLKPFPVAVMARFKNPKTGKVSIWVQLRKENLVAKLENLRVGLDKHLRNYIYVNDKGSSLNTVLSILPSLPTIELKKQLAIYIDHFNGGKPIKKLPNDRLTELLDFELINSFDSLAVSLDATTSESEVFEAKLSQQITALGLNISAYRTDLIIRYFIEDEVKIKAGLKKVSFVVDAEIISTDGQTFATLDDNYKVSNASRNVATELALAMFADNITTVITNSAIVFINKTNKIIPLPEGFRHK